MSIFLIIVLVITNIDVLIISLVTIIHVIVVVFYFRKDVFKSYFW